MELNSILTIGHSTHETGKFLEILDSFSIRLVADIRSLPGSTKFPRFNKELLSKTLKEHGIGYRHFPELGGLRHSSKDSKNTGWINKAFRGYADYMETENFIEAIKSLEKAANEHVTVMMCAEVLYWRCHRSLVADQLKLRGWKVFHITAPYKSSEHSYTTPARIINGQLTYYGIT